MLNSEEMDDLMKGFDRLQDNIIKLQKDIKRLEQNQCSKCIAQKSKDTFYGDYVGEKT